MADNVIEGHFEKGGDPTLVARTAIAAVLAAHPKVCESCANMCAEMIADNRELVMQLLGTICEIMGEEWALDEEQVRELARCSMPTSSMLRAAASPAPSTSS